MTDRAQSVATHGPLCGCLVCWTLTDLDDDRDGKAIARAAEWDTPAD